MKRKKLVVLFIPLLLILLALPYFVDYQLVKVQKQPFFAKETTIGNEVVATEYRGIGYHVVEEEAVNGEMVLSFNSLLMDYKPSE